MSTFVITISWEAMNAYLISSLDDEILKIRIVNMIAFDGNAHHFRNISELQRENRFQLILSRYNGILL